MGAASWGQLIQETSRSNHHPGLLLIRDLKGSGCDQLHRPHQLLLPLLLLGRMGPVDPHGQEELEGRFVLSAREILNTPRLHVSRIITLYFHLKPMKDPISHHIHHKHHTKCLACSLIWSSNIFQDSVFCRRPPSKASFDKSSAAVLRFFLSRLMPTPSKAWV